MIRFLLATVGAFAVLSAPSLAQMVPGEGPLDISSDDFEGFEEEGRLVYTGDVNMVRGDTRLRADRIDVFFVRNESGARSIERVVAVGEVYYVTPNEVAHGDRGVYNLVIEQITMTGAVVLTQGCNVSTGERLVVDLQGGSARLTGGEAEDRRVRSVFFDTPDSETAPSRDCPQPTIPGRGPRPFPEENG
jgi:lipopolysaccharide export system protein LptA